MSEHGNTDGNKSVGKRLRLVTLNKQQNEVYVLRERPSRVYIKRALKLIKEGYAMVTKTLDRQIHRLRGLHIESVQHRDNGEEEARRESSALYGKHDSRMLDGKGRLGSMESSREKSW